MPKFKLVRHLLASTTLGTLTPSYDTRFGTATDTSTGWITFDLRPGCRRIWCNSSGGNDANDGLTAATAKATWDAAFALFLNGSFTPGDQLMVAGTGGRTYDDGCTHNWTFNSGFSLAYPMMVLSYDPGDAANSSKYGKLVGNDMPTLVIPDHTIHSTPSLEVYGESGNNYMGVQGIEFDGQGFSQQHLQFLGNHTGIVFQNCRFKEIEPVFEGSTANGFINTVHVSKCSSWGQWNSNSGNGAAGFINYCTGLRLQDVVAVHGGWKLGASRSDDPSVGGASVFGHGIYSAAEMEDCRYDRVVFVDSAADGANFRGNIAATCIVSIDEPIAGQIGGYSFSPSEAPDGTLVTVDDWLIMGSADISATAPRGGGPNNTNTQSGTYIRKVAMFDNPKYGPQPNIYFTSACNNSDEIVHYWLIDKVRGYNWSPNLLGDPGAFPDHVNVTFNDCILDIAGKPGVTAWGSPPPNYKTRAQVYAAMGYTEDTTVGKAELVNDMLWRPDLPWAQALISVGLPSMGLTPSYPLVSPPDMTGETPRAVY